MGMHNHVMGAMARAASADCSPCAREVETRTIIKGALAIGEIVKILDKREGRNRRITSQEILFHSDAKALLKGCAARPGSAISTKETTVDED